MPKWEVEARTNQRYSWDVILSDSESSTSVRFNYLDSRAKNALIKLVDAANAADSVVEKPTEVMSDYKAHKDNMPCCICGTNAYHHGVLDRVGNQYCSQTCYEAKTSNNILYLSEEDRKLFREMLDSYKKKLFAMRMDSIPTSTSTSPTINVASPFIHLDEAQEYHGNSVDAYASWAKQTQAKLKEKQSQSANYQCCSCSVTFSSAEQPKRNMEDRYCCDECYERERAYECYDCHKLIQYSFASDKQHGQWHRTNTGDGLQHRICHMCAEKHAAVQLHDVRWEKKEIELTAKKEPLSTWKEFIPLERSAIQQQADPGVLPDSTDEEGKTWRERAPLF